MLSDQRLTSEIRGGQYLTAIGMAILYYDHLLNLGDEVKFMWMRPMTKMKLLFIFHRYLANLACVHIFFGFSGLIRAPRDVSCKTQIIVLCLLGGWSFSIGGYMMIVRVYALWDHRKRIFRVLLTAFAISNVSMIACLVWGGISLERHTAFNNKLTHGCAILTIPKGAIGLWASQAFFDLFVLVLTIVNAAERPRLTNVKLISDLLRDGVISFLVLFLLRIWNLVVSSMNDPAMFMMPILFTFAMVTVLLSRLLLRMEKITSRVSTISTVRLLDWQRESHELGFRA